MYEGCSNYWNRVNYMEHGRDTNLILYDWAKQLYFSLHIKYQSYSYTQSITDDIRRASHRGMRSTPTSQTLHQQVTMALMRLWQPQSFSIYTSCNQMHFIRHGTHLSHTYVQLISYKNMLLRCYFAVQYPSQF